MLRKVAKVWCMQSRAYGRANMMGRLSYVCKSLGWGEVSQRDMLEWTGGRVLMAICWRCGRSWRNTAVYTDGYSERNVVSRGKNLWTWTHTGPHFPQTKTGSAMKDKDRCTACTICDSMVVHKPHHCFASFITSFSTLPTPCQLKYQRTFFLNTVRVTLP